jgi:hypothetical protein
LNKQNEEHTAWLSSIADTGKRMFHAKCDDCYMATNDRQERLFVARLLEFCQTGKVLLRGCMMGDKASKELASFLLTDFTSPGNDKVSLACACVGLSCF